MSSIRSNPSERFPPYTGTISSAGGSTLRKSNMHPAHQYEATGATVASSNAANGGNGTNGGNGAAGSPAISHGGQSMTPQETEAMRQAILGLVNVWLSRMSLMSGITTFFAGIDGQLLAYAYPSTVTDSQTDTGYRIAVTSLAGAMILHWMAAIISYIACFALYRYELVDARQEEVHNGVTALRTGIPSTKSYSPLLGSAFSVPQLNAAYIGVTQFHPYSFRVTGPGVTGSNASIEAPNTHGIPKLPMNLTAVNDACVGITVVGFVLAILGILAYMWAFLPSYVSIFSTICLSISVLIGLWVLR